MAGFDLRDGLGITPVGLVGPPPTLPVGAALREDRAGGFLPDRSGIVRGYGDWAGGFGPGIPVRDDGGLRREILFTSLRLFEGEIAGHIDTLRGRLGYRVQGRFDEFRACQVDGLLGFSRPLCRRLGRSAILLGLLAFVLSLRGERRPVPPAPSRDAVGRSSRFPLLPLAPRPVVGRAVAPVGPVEPPPFALPAVVRTFVAPLGPSAELRRKAR